jgi:hypothetical protein
MSFARAGALGRGFGRMGAGGAPGWVLPGALVDLDFANAHYWGGSPDSLLSIARASSGYGQRADGSLVSFTSNVLRITNQGLLIEEPRTNLALQSNQFDTTWALVNNATLSSAATVAPDGANSGWKLKRDSAAASFRVQQLGIAVTSGSTYSVSVYAKPGEITWLRLSDGNKANGDAWFNLSTGAVGTVAAGIASATISPAANGFYRCTIVYATTTTTAVVQIWLAPGDNQSTFGAGNTSDGLYIWGAQDELGAFPTSYIPTTTASATRAEDNVTAAATINNLVRATAGSAYVSAGKSPNASGAGGNPTALGEAASSPCLFNTAGPASLPRWRTWNGTRNLSCVDGGVNITDAYLPGAVGWDGTGVSIVTNGGTVASDANPIGTYNTLAFGRDSNTTGLDAFNGYIKRAAFWNSRLPDAMLKTLSAR